MNQNSPQARGLVGWWAYQPGSVDLLQDFVRDYQGTAEGNPTFVTDSDMGWGMDLDGSDALVLPTDFPDSTSNWTVAFWYKRSATGEDDILWGRWKDFSNERQLQVFFNAATNDIQVNVPFIKAVLTSNSAVTDTTDVHHTVVTRTGDVWTVYLDGVADGSATDSTTQESALTTSPMIGWERLTSTNFFNGRIYDVRVYDVPKSAAEIRQMWHPTTRWDLYYEMGRVFYSFPASTSRLPILGVG